MQTIGAFDIGIKNLSYCVATFDVSGSLHHIDKWANLNLLADGASSQSQTRCLCGGPASYADHAPSAEGSATGIVRLYCKKCAKRAEKPPLELPAGAKLVDWREWAVGKVADSAKAAKRYTKAALESKAAALRLMPYKPTKAKGVTLQTLLAHMERCLSAELPHLARAATIRLENQPAEFAPHMKSVQIMLFVLLDHRLRQEYGWTGKIEFVHASVKTRGTDAGTGKAAKASRKTAGSQRAMDLLEAAGPRVAADLAWLKGQARQIDAAETLLMCVDGVQTPS